MKTLVCCGVLLLVIVTAEEAQNTTDVVPPIVPPVAPVAPVVPPVPPIVTPEPVIERSSHIHHHHHESPPFQGFWKKRLVWRPRWVKTWQEKKIYVAVWKKMWGPAEVKEWVPVPKPPPGWVKHSGVSFIKVGR